VGADGPRLAFVWQAQYTELSGCLSRGRRSTQNAQYTELPGCLSRGRCGTQSLLEELRRVGAAGPRLAFVCALRYFK